MSVNDVSSSQWPTATTMLSGERTDPSVFKARQKRMKERHRGNTGNGCGPDLAMVARMWGTPTTRDWKDGASDLTNVPENGLLGRMAANWSTPRASDAEKGGPNQSFGAGGTPLPAQAAQWSTPTARDFMPAHTEEYIAAKKAEGHGMSNLNDQVDKWQTPSVADTQGGRMTRSADRSNELLLKGQAEATSLASILPDLPISTVGEESSHIRRSLNPLFVEWLMGWLRGWTLLALTPPTSNAYACSATELFLWKRRMRSALLQLGLPPEAAPAQQSLFA